MEMAGFPPRKGFDEEAALTLNLPELQALIESEFPVESVVYEFGLPYFLVRLPPQHRENFERLVSKLKPYRVIPVLRKGMLGETIIRIMSKPPPPKKPSRTPLILFLVTCVTIFISGYFNSTVWNFLFQESIFLHAAFFTIGLLAIVGLHELGHKTAAALRGMESTAPYFIPGPPFPIGFGTLGAVIMQKEPPTNRNQLFDLGFSGPLTGFAITIIVAAVSLGMAKAVDPSILAQLEAEGVQIINLPTSLAWEMLARIVRPGIEGRLMLTPPLGLAAWIGFIVTYLNLLPAWQLDGGHIARAMFGERGHLISSFIGIIVAFATGFWFFGLIILFFMGRRHMGPLDDLTPLSRGRMALGGLAYLILALSAVILW
jgi:Zn-dependent protease